MSDLENYLKEVKARCESASLERVVQKLSGGGYITEQVVPDDTARVIRSDVPKLVAMVEWLMQFAPTEFDDEMVGLEKIARGKHE